MCFILKQVKLLFSNQCILRVASNRFLCWGTSPLCNEQSSLLLTPSLTCCFHHPLKSLFIPLYFHLWDQRPFRFMHAVAGQKCLFQNEKVGKAVNYEYHPPPPSCLGGGQALGCAEMYTATKDSLLPSLFPQN